MFEFFADRAHEAMQFARFTDRARKVMQLANQEAQRFNHEYIGTEHILLGLVKEGSGVAANVLKNLDIDLRRIRLEVEKVIPSRPAVVVLGRLPRTPRARKVIEYSIEEARNLNHNYVGTEHLLLGLLREQEGVAAQVLMNLGLGVGGLRAVVLEYLARGPHLDKEPEWFLQSARAAGSWVGSYWGLCAWRTPTEALPEPEQRLHVLEGQLRIIRVVLSILIGVLLGVALGGEPGAFAGLLLGTLVGLVGGRVLGAVIGAAPGYVLAAIHLHGQGWCWIGLLAGAALGACLGDLGPPLFGRRR